MVILDAPFWPPNKHVSKFCPMYFTHFSLLHLSFSALLSQLWLIFLLCRLMPELAKLIVSYSVVLSRQLPIKKSGTTLICVCESGGLSRRDLAAQVMEELRSPQRTAVLPGNMQGWASPAGLWGAWGRQRKCISQIFSLNIWYNTILSTQNWVKHRLIIISNVIIN